jgi:hypothetical protein
VWALWGPTGSVGALNCFQVYLRIVGPTTALARLPVWISRINDATIEAPLAVGNGTRGDLRGIHEGLALRG